MKYWAELDSNNFVVNILVTEANKAGKDFIDSLSGTYKEINDRSRAEVGGQYLAEKDLFIRMKPRESYILNDDYDWVPPIPQPDAPGIWAWDKSKLAWVNLQQD